MRLPPGLPLAALGPFTPLLPGTLAAEIASEVPDIVVQARRLDAARGASYRPWEGARASATLLYGNGLRRGFANTEKQPGYTTMNLGFAQEFRAFDGGAWTARVDLINLTDQTVQLRDGSGIGVGAPQFLPRRAIYGGLSRAF